ncbi:MAG: Tat pathway signal protein, partial [Thermoguttaceae bacterium]|nr:Tat pathway signal protein [Thermoguttaceae bacterium]
MDASRREFLKTSGSALVASPLLAALSASPALSSFAAESASNDMIWSILLHLGQNMWGDSPTAYSPPTDKFGCDEALWDEITEKCASSGLTQVVIDLGEAVRYKSHPELGIEGAWSIDRLRADLERLRKLGLEPIPKLNFSSCHDFWLHPYDRMISTPVYYQVCSDLIKEVCEIFDKPRFFHLGYDEEGYECQSTYDYVVIRQGELWKRDFLFFVEEVEKYGVR